MYTDLSPLPWTGVLKEKFSNLRVGILGGGGEFKKQIPLKVLVPIREFPPKLEDFTLFLTKTKFFSNYFFN